MNYPFPTFLGDNSATVRPLPKVVDQFVSGHSQRQEITLKVKVIYPDLVVVEPRYNERPTIIAFALRPTNEVWTAARRAADAAARDRETVRDAEAAELSDLEDLV